MSAVEYISDHNSDLTILKYLLNKKDISLLQFLIYFGGYVECTVVLNLKIHFQYTVFVGEEWLLGNGSTQVWFLFHPGSQYIINWPSLI